MKAIYIDVKNKTFRTEKHRLIFCAKSPLIDALFTSTLGGAGVDFYEAGLEFVSIEEKAKEPTVVIIRSINEKFEILFKTIKKKELMRIYEGYENKLGTYALEKYLLNKFKDLYKKENGYHDFRIVTVGPASFTTDMGALNSMVTSYLALRIGLEEADLVLYL